MTQKTFDTIISTERKSLSVVEGVEYLGVGVE